MSKNAFKNTAFRTFVYEIGRRLLIGTVTRTTKWSIKKLNEEPTKNPPKDTTKEHLVKFEFRDFLTNSDNPSLDDYIDLAGSTAGLTHIFEPSE